MNRFQLFLDTHNVELFRKATSELGTIFYRQLSGDGIKEPFTYEIVYFSGSRIARFVGTPNEELKKLCTIRRLLDVSEPQQKETIKQ